MIRQTAYTINLRAKRCKPTNSSNSTKETNSSLPTIESLLKVKKLALRRRVWFKALSPIERGVLDLTVKYVDNVKSIKLAKVLMAITQKLLQATENTVDRLKRTIGAPLARQISDLAILWGNASAKCWTTNSGFIAFLAVTNVAHTEVQ